MQALALLQILTNPLRSPRQQKNLQRESPVGFFMGISISYFRHQGMGEEGCIGVKLL